MKKFILLALIGSIFQACNLIKHQQEVAQVVDNDPVEVSKSDDDLPYRATPEKRVDLIHTKLNVKLDWEKEQMQGEAELTLSPHFYKTKVIDIDAKGMDIKSVALLDSAGKKQSVNYEADSVQIHVKLAKEISSSDTLKLYIQYVSKPNDLKLEGSQAISDRKGLYFINGNGKDKVKPQQVWTQGETESSSCWFPTIDKPNQKSSQELTVTVDAKYNTLSNGNLINSVKNSDGTRTDYWKQDKIHAPYLFVLVVGEFAVIKDEWNGMQVNYLVEPKDSASAKAVFGNTPEMLTFYSDLLGVQYPWDKYDQVIVRDYISGAMENTSAVIHGTWVFSDIREQIDGDHEDVIAHELFHHWFGDLVTCESWSNLPLNESFATYGEYLWLEHKYGKMRAEFQLFNNLRAYLGEDEKKDLIRFHYKDREEMFDRHSYDKGGLILHMLRDFVGDEAFFASLKHYLNKHAYQTVEIHDLRIAFEEVTGFDLNWFFNQWFLDKGHPKLKINYEVKSDSLLLTVEQTQTNDWPVFKFPVTVGIYEGGKPKEKEIWVSKRKETFLFEVIDTPMLVDFDTKKVLLAEYDYSKTADEALVQFQKGKHLLDKVQAFRAIRQDTSNASLEILDLAIKDTFDLVRKVGILFYSKIPQGQEDDHYETLVHLFKKDESSGVRAAALRHLRGSFPEDSSLIFLYKKALADSSVLVNITGLNILKDVAREDALLRAVSMEDDTNEDIIVTLCGLYEDVKDESKIKYFEKALYLTESYRRKAVIKSFTKYLLSKRSEFVNKGARMLKKIAIYDNDPSIRKECILALNNLLKDSNKRLEDIEKDIKDQKASTKGKLYDLKMLEEKREEIKKENDKLKKIIVEAINLEKDPQNVKEYTDLGLFDIKVEESK